MPLPAARTNDVINSLKEDIAQANDINRVRCQSRKRSADDQVEKT